MNYYMNYNADPAGWTVEEAGFDSGCMAKCESIFTQGNGYMNIRCALEEDYVGQCRDTFIAGTFDKSMPDEVTELPNLPDAAGLVIKINKERFSMEKGRLLAYSRKLDLRNGECVREVTWESPQKERIKFVFRRFVSLAEQHVAAFQMEVTPLTGAVEIEIESGISSRSSNMGAQHCTDGEKRLLDGECLRLITRTSQSDIPVAVHCVHRFSKDPDFELPVIERRRLVKRFCFLADEKQTFKMDKTVCYHTGRDKEFEEPEYPSGTADARLVAEKGEECIRRNKEKSYEEMLEESARVWKDYWERMDVRIESPNSMDQLGVRFALYHLNIMINRKDNRVGIGAKGLTGEGYKGHSFWDTEMFLLPHYLLTDPGAARTLLEYRYRTLPGAYRKAEENNYEGAMFPWESAWMDDGEVTPLYGAADVVTGECIPIYTGIREHHITADIAWAVWLYYNATGDDEFMDKYGCELLIETARFWASRLEWKEEAGRYEIWGVIGPDEYKEDVDNNAFTNYLATYNLWTAAEAIDRMPERWGGAWERLRKSYDLEDKKKEFREKADKIYLPVPNRDGIVPQNDEYLSLEKIDLSKYRTQQGVSTIYEDYSPAQMNHFMVSKQADLVMLLRIMPGLFDEETRLRNFLFYESRTLHDSSLSHGQHCVVAAWLGQEEMALDMYRYAVNIDLGPNPHSSDEGIHSAAMGGIWQCNICGFAGLKWDDGRLSLENHLPAKWNRMEFKVWWHGTQIKVALTHDMITAVHLSGPEISLRMNGRTYYLKAGGQVSDDNKQTDAVRYKGVIFDLDGVLCHTDQYHYCAWKKIADELGIPFDEKTNRRLRGVSRMESLEIILEQSRESVTEERKRILAEEKNDYYKELLSEITSADMAAPVRKMLSSLRKKGIKLAVGSSSKNASYILERLNAEKEFDMVCDGTMITHSKPHPEVFIKAAEGLGLEPEECLVVEDAPSGLEAAKAAGMDCAVIGSGTWPQKPDFEISGAEEIMKIFE